jgi:peptide chain release factor 1
LNEYLSQEASASIEGEGVFKELKHERGVHRIQRVPQTESMGRVHTSTMSVVVMPQPEEIDVEVDTKDLKIDTFRASGAGGQHVNTTDSAVRITHIPTGMSVSVQEERSQHKNRSKAFKVLKARLFDIQLQKSLEERKMERKQQIGSLERFERIRTYNFPQDRITDHRLGTSLHGMEDFLSGGEALGYLIQQLVKQEEAKALENLLTSNVQ